MSNTQVYAGNTGATIQVATDTVSADVYQRIKLISGASGTNDGDVSSAIGLPIRLAPKITAAGSTMTRVSDTNAYAFGDFIANNVTAASCTLANSGFTIAAARANDMQGRLLRCILQISGTVTVNAIFRVHFFNLNPLSSAPANGDNGAFVPANKANYLGRMDVTVATAFGDGAMGFGFPTEANYIDFTPDSGTQNIYALLEARAAFTPTNAEVFTLTTVTE